MVGCSSRPTHTHQTIGSLKTHFTRFRLPTIERRRLIANHALNDIALTIIRQPENPSPHFQAAYYVYKHKHKTHDYQHQKQPEKTKPLDHKPNGFCQINEISGCPKDSLKGSLKPNPQNQLTLTLQPIAATPAILPLQTFPPKCPRRPQIRPSHKAAE